MRGQFTALWRRARGGGEDAEKPVVPNPVPLFLSSDSFAEDEVPCGDPVPILRVVPAEDLRVPAAGGRGCNGKREYLSASETDAVWRKHNRCGGRAKEWVPRLEGEKPSAIGTSVCVRWNCDESYARCDVQGGESLTSKKNFYAGFGGCLQEEIEVKLGWLALFFLAEHAGPLDRVPSPGGE